MIKHFCDCCHEETNQRHLSEFKFKLHLEKIYSKNTLQCSLDDNLTSDCYEKYELCPKCYNQIVYEAVKKLQEKQLDNKDII